MQANPPPAAQKSTRRERARTWLIAAAIFVAGGVAGGLLAGLTGGQPSPGSGPTRRRPGPPRPAAPARRRR